MDDAKVTSLDRLTGHGQRGGHDSRLLQPESALFVQAAESGYAYTLLE